MCNGKTRKGGREERGSKEGKQYLKQQDKKFPPN